MREKDAPSNAYDWYRKSAQRSGCVSIGGVEVRASKEGSVWCIDEFELTKAIRNQRAELAKTERITRDYENGIIHGKTGETIRTTWGGYEIQGKFRFVWSDFRRATKDSYGTWYCNSCNKPADTKHDKPECHLCSDWNGCGKDCTLSEVYCKKCGYCLKI
jgi:hypothetical protein